VVKAEDPRRPDGGRLGAPAFFDAVNAGKEPLAVDLRGPGLASLLAAADVVITSARPRAFEQLGVDVDEVLAASPTVWVSVTAYGWSGPERNRVGFGDDVAAGAGLVAVHPDDGEPRFAGDAVADPLCGTLAATAALAALAAGGSWFIDASLVGAARYAVAGGGGATVPARRGEDGRWAVEAPGGPEPVAPPRARRGR
jgi:crotonobetainyl-CoA:carnitine CoA-transferase CaiB-like acyl-CoA transferase